MFNWFPSYRNANNQWSARINNWFGAGAYNKSEGRRYYLDFAGARFSIIKEKKSAY